MRNQLNLEVFAGETYNGSALLTLNHNHIVRSVDMSKDGQWAATGCQDKTLRLFDLQKPEEPTLFGPGGVAHKSLVRSLVLDMNRRVLVSVDDKEMRCVSASCLGGGKSDRSVPYE